MSLVKRIKAAAIALLSREDVVRATVRQYETADTFGRRYQREAIDFTQRFAGYVKVATSRTAAAIALTDLKLYRKANPRSKTWATRKVSNVARKRLELGCLQTTKAMSAMADDLEEIVDPNHPINMVLRKANPELSGFELFELTEMLQALAGTFYWICVPGSNGWPVEIWPGFPQYMRPIASRSDVIDHYVYGRGMEVETKVNRNQVVTFRRPNPIGNPYVGVADLAACVVEADLSAAFAQFALTMLDRGAQPGLTLVIPGLTDQQREAVEAELRRKVDGARNAARSLVISPPPAHADKVQIERWESASKEAGYLAGQSEDTVLRRIAACFDIPVGLITMEEQSVANGRVAAPHWQLMSILPKCRRMEETLNELFLPVFHNALGDDSLFLRFDNPVREDMDVMTRVAVANFGAGILTKNEARGLIEYPPVDGGDDFKPEPDPFGSFGIDGAPDEGDTTPAMTDEKAVALKGAHPVDCGCDCCDADHPSGVKQLGSREDVRALDAAVREWLRQVIPGVMASVRAGGVISIDLSTAQSRAAFDSAIGDLIERVFSGAYNETASAMRSRGAELLDMGVENPRAEAYFTRQRTRLFDSVSRTATDQIMRTLGEGVTNGETPNELVNRVRAVAGELEQYQAERIARTETARAYGDARTSAWKDSGTVSHKEWLLAPGGCPICADLKRKRGKVPLDEPFAKIGDTFTGGGRTYTVGYEDVYSAPLHPNCRCSVGAVFTEERQ